MKHTQTFEQFINEGDYTAYLSSSNFKSRIDKIMTNANYVIGDDYLIHINSVGDITFDLYKKSPKFDPSKVEKLLKDNGLIFKFKTGRHGAYHAD